MAENYDYVCSRCGKPTQRDLLTVKTIVFKEIGMKPKTLRSRNKEWLCPSCVASDSDWLLPRRSVSELRTRLRVRKAKVNGQNI